MGDHEQLDPEIAAHYASVSEQQRLGPWSPERVRTWELLGRHLPPPPAVVLDVGGAAGVYALPLAAQGYQVHLVDPLARHVQQALRASGEQPDGPLASATVGDARQLDRPDASVDAALLFGPLYHLTERADRIRALVEARRVLRPGGVLAGAAISRFASTLDGLLRGYLDEPGFEAIVERDVREGQHRNPTGRPEWFTTAYFHLPEDLAQEVGEAGLRLHAVFAVEGPAWMLPDIERRLADPAHRERLLVSRVTDSLRIRIGESPGQTAERRLRTATNQRFGTLDDCFRLGGWVFNGRRRPASACRVRRSASSTRSSLPGRAAAARLGPPRRVGCARRDVPSQAGP